MATVIPQPTISPSTELGRLIGILNTNLAALNVALGERVVGHRLSVPRYAATGATTTQIRLGSVSPSGSKPWAVLLVRARESNNPGGDLSVTSRMNFTSDPSTGTLHIYEPSGLTLNTYYDLDFLVLE